MGASLVVAMCVGALGSVPAARAQPGPKSSFDLGEWQGKSEWLVQGSVLLVRNFVSKSEAASLRTTAAKLFAVDNGPRWKEAVYNNAFLQGPHARELLTKDVMQLEHRIESLTGINMHPDEALMMFARHRPGAMPPGHFIRNVHHDKNTAERRTVTALVYLSTATSDAEGGHTIFPTLPRASGVRAAGGQAPPEDDGDPIAYLRDAFEGAFRDGRRMLPNRDLIGEGEGAWDEKALGLVQQECALALEGRNRVLAVRPRRGTALFFWHVWPNGTANPSAWHAACHAAKGAPRFTAQKFKEPVMGGAIEDRSPESSRGGRSEL